MAIIFTPDNFDPQHAFAMAWGEVREDIYKQAPGFDSHFNPIVTTAGAVPPNFDLWFVYSPLPREAYISARAIDTPDDPDYAPSLTAFTGTPDSLTQVGNPAFDGTPMTVPLHYGERIYFRVRQTIVNGVPANGTQLVFTIEAAPFGIAPAGTILIPDDVSGYPAALVNPQTGEVIGYVPFPAGEAGAALADGTYLVQSFDNNNHELWKTVNNQLKKVADVAIVPHSSGYVTTNRVNRFWVGWAGNSSVPVFAQIWQVEADGTISGSWTTTEYGMKGLAPSVDESTLYVSGVGAPPHPVKKFDIATGAYTTDFIAGVGGRTYRNDILSFPDGSVVVVTSAGGVDTIRKYDSAGSPVWTQNLPGGTLYDHMSYYGNDNASFQVWLQGLGDPLDFQVLRISLATGATMPGYEANFAFFNEGVNQQGTSTIPFGVSGSCPIISTSQPIVTLTGQVIETNIPIDCCFEGPGKPPPPITTEPPPIFQYEAECDEGGDVPDGNAPTNSEDWRYAFA